VSQPPRIDLAELHAMVTSLERLIADATRTVAELKRGIAAAESTSDTSAESVPSPAAAEHRDASSKTAPVAAATPDPFPGPGPLPETPWSRRRVRPRPTTASSSSRTSLSNQPPPPTKHVPPSPRPPPTAMENAGPEPGPAQRGAVPPDSDTALRGAIRRAPIAPPQLPVDLRGTGTTPSRSHHGKLPAGPGLEPESALANTVTGIPELQLEPSPDSGTYRIAVDMATRHGLELIGFEMTSVDLAAMHELVAAIDDMLAKYRIALRGIEITHPHAGDATHGLPSRMRSQPAALWIVLDGATLTSPSGSTPSQSWLRRRRNTERPVYAAVVREFAGVLDIAGGYRAREEAQSRLIAESLRGGGELLYSPFDPRLALVEAFAEVTLRGKRARGPAKVLHEILVKTARVDRAE